MPTGKQSKLLENKDNLHKLTKKQLIEILEIELELRLNKNVNMKKHYSYSKSRVNNAKIAIRGFWSRRADTVVRARIKKHINTIKEHSK